VADEDGFGAGLERALQRGDGAAIPVGLEDGRAGLRIGQLRHVEVEHDRHLELTGLRKISRQRGSSKGTRNFHSPQTRAPWMW
jgi:hypothetical protein